MSEFIKFAIIGESFNYYNPNGDDFTKGDVIQMTLADAQPFIEAGDIEPVDVDTPLTEGLTRDDRVEMLERIRGEQRAEIQSLKDELEAKDTLINELTTQNQALLDTTSGDVPDMTEAERKIILSDVVNNAPDDAFKKDGLLTKAYLKDSVSFAETVTQEELQAVIDEVTYGK